MKLIAVDLESGLPDVPPPTVGEQWILVRFRGAPVGILKFAGRGCTGAELARMIADRFGDRMMRLQYREEAFGSQPAASIDLPSITVAVC